jgi:hypothetical protein
MQTIPLTDRPIGWLLLLAEVRKRESNNLNAKRTSVAGEGSTEPNLYLRF